MPPLRVTNLCQITQFRPPPPPKLWPLSRPSKRQHDEQFESRLRWYSCCLGCVFVVVGGVGNWARRIVVVEQRSRRVLFCQIQAGQVRACAQCTRYASLSLSLCLWHRVRARTAHSRAVYSLPAGTDCCCSSTVRAQHDITEPRSVHTLAPFSRDAAGRVSRVWQCESTSVVYLPTLSNKYCVTLKGAVL